MRKRLITPTPDTIRAQGKGWLDVERAAVVEATSEDKEFPVELAFASEVHEAGERLRRGAKRFG